MAFFFEGAFGTYYQSKIKADEPCESGNLSHPDIVSAIHLEYINAGANGIKTNTFGANRINFPDPERLDDILIKGCDLAFKAVGETGVRVFADIGPVYLSDQTGAEGLSDEYLYIAEKFVSLGARCFIFETMPGFEPLKEAIDFISENVPDGFVVVSFAVMQDGYTTEGNYYKDLIEQAVCHPGVSVCGLNCLCGPAHLSELISQLPKPGKPICAMPNSGYPSNIGGRTVYIDNADYFAGRIKEIFESGVEYLGGCCGTTPDHIRKAVELVSGTVQGETGTRKICTASGSSVKKSATTDILRTAEDRKLIAVEIDPPADTDPGFLIDAAGKAGAEGANLITVADSPLARTRADSIILAARIQRETGIPVMPHLSCRDRNQIGIKAALLGGSIEGIRNVLVVTGDPVSKTDRADVKGMFSFNSTKLISYISRLNDEVFTQAPYSIAAALNVNAVNFDAELRRAEVKLDAGAELFLTQPVFSQSAAENISRAKDVLGNTVLAGILPVAGYRNALFLNNEVPGIDIPQDFIDSLKDIGKQECDEKITLFMAETIGGIMDVVRGFYLITPMKRIDSVISLIRLIRGSENKSEQY